MRILKKIKKFLPEYKRRDDLNKMNENYKENLKDLSKHLSRASLEIIFCIKIIGENEGFESDLYKNMCKINENIFSLKEKVKNEY